MMSSRLPKWKGRLPQFCGRASCRCPTVPELECADQGDVHSELCTPETRKILGENLHATFIHAGDSNVHVAEISVASHLSARLPEDACHNSFDGGGPLLDTACPRACGSVASKRIHRVATPLACGELQSFEKKHAEQEAAPCIRDWWVRMTRVRPQVGLLSGGTA